MPGGKKKCLEEVGHLTVHFDRWMIKVSLLLEITDWFLSKSWNMISRGSIMLKSSYHWQIHFLIVWTLKCSHTCRLSMCAYTHTPICNHTHTQETFALTPFEDELPNHFVDFVSLCSWFKCTQRWVMICRNLCKIIQVCFDYLLV